MFNASFLISVSFVLSLLVALFDPGMVGDHDGSRGDIRRFCEELMYAECNIPG